MQLLNGRTKGFVLDQYRILDSIRQDRVGMVFKAEDTTAKQLVSLKVLPTDRASDPTILQAFMREVRAAARVNHPNVARVLDVGCWQGTHFVVSEFVPGMTFDRVVAEKGPLPPRVAAQLVAQIAVGLIHSHIDGLIHRDVKPNNIVLMPNRHAKLIDLGLTHMLESPWGRVTKRLCTKEYAEEIAHIAPEQAWGCELDARSDIYSLGSTFYFLLTGEVPFPGLAQEIMVARQLRGISSPAELNPDISPALDAIVRKMGAKDPKERYQSARDVVAALQAWVPAAQSEAIGLALEDPSVTVPFTQSHPIVDMPDPDPDQDSAPAPAPTPAKSGGIRAFFRRLLGR
jgi:serine/threonine-protein kinase